VTEEEWLACTDPWLMLEYLSGKGSDRKLRLFACTCAREILSPLSRIRCSDHVEIAERFAEGLATEEEREFALLYARPIAERLEAASSVDAYAAEAAFALVIPGGYASAEQTLEYVISALRVERGIDSWRDAERPEVQAIRSLHCHFVREIFGNLFRPISLNPFWLSWKDRTLPKLAQAIYDERRFEDMPILADALEDAGCADAAILSHCRGPGPHVRGCWVLDLLLGKQ
jgi:hypothetical protein